MTDSSMYKFTLIYPRIFLIVAVNAYLADENETGLGISELAECHWFLCYQTCEHNILKMSEPVLMPNSTSSPRSKVMKRLTLGVRRSKSHKPEDI